MLGRKTLPEKTVEDWMEEALRKIPLYTEEWSNFNPSDPGITILENLTLFNVLQQSQIGKITPQVLKKLLMLPGFSQEPGRCARVLLEAAGVKEPLKLEANQKFYLGDTVFETDRAQTIANRRVIAVYGETDGQITDCSEVLRSEVPIGVPIFGSHPKAGDKIYLMMDEMPENEELIFYIKTVPAPYRNPFVESVNSRFAVIRWQYYTEDGFQPLSCKDKTGTLLCDGELVFWGQKKPAVYRELPAQGYCICGELVQAEYDVAPQILGIFGFLFEVWQKETSCVMRSFKKSAEHEVSCEFLEDEYVRVYCREGDGKSYRLYEPAAQEGIRGRFYRRERLSDGRIAVHFDRQSFGFGPARVKDAVRIAVYNERMMRKYELGTVYGYDDQEIELPAEHIVPESFCLLAERIDADGVAYYDFVKPDREQEDELSYELLPAEGKIRIRDAGDYIEAKLYLCSLASTRGAQGNIRAGSRLYAPGLPDSVVFTNPAPGAGGRYQETLEETRERFCRDVETPAAVVKMSDYEQLVRRIAGLCIHKVRAVRDDKENKVTVAVKPWSEEPLPKLSALYQRVIEKYLDAHRLLTVKICLAQPQYVAVDVRGTIYVKRHYEHYREEIEAVLREHLDYVRGDQQFGETLKFDRLFYSLERLECVESVQSLQIYPQNRKLAAVQGMDIVPREDCLLYPGNFDLDMNAGSAADGWAKGASR